MLTSTIKKALKNSVHSNELLQVMDYAVFPAGKLFRPKLVEALALDLNKTLSNNHLHLAAALELHHAYTLVHDDLPAMDNDLIRRGKPSTHAAFSEWKAILAGDALLIASFDELMKIDHPKLKELHRLFSWATGAKGLIHGQYRDLGANGKVSFSEVVRIHELKTARLIQIATLGSLILSENTSTLKNKLNFLRIGRDIGVSFQLLDDLSELAVDEVSSHEKEINPFLHSLIPAMNELTVTHLRLNINLKLHALGHLNQMLLEYFKKNQENLLQNFALIEKHCGTSKDLEKLKDWITSFV